LVVDDVLAENVGHGCNGDGLRKQIDSAVTFAVSLNLQRHSLEVFWQIVRLIREFVPFLFIAAFSTF
jgi:hypothetical protein